MRALAFVGLGFGLILASQSQAMTVASQPRANAPALTMVEYFCSPGFVPISGGRCVATQARDEIELFVNEPVETAPTPRRHRRHGLSERY